MRVITGAARGRKLREPKGENIRPTADKVKEALFSIIQFDIEGRDTLDLFAGTGQLGIEALSRGAASCAFVDESREAMELIRANAEHCGFGGEKFIQSEALAYIRRAGKFGLILADPPYDTGLLDKTLREIFAFDILLPGGIIVCECAADKEPYPAAEPYRLVREYRYGKTKLVVYTKN